MPFRPGITITIKGRKAMRSPSRLDRLDEGQLEMLEEIDEGRSPYANITRDRFKQTVRTLESLRKDGYIVLSASY